MPLIVLKSRLKKFKLPIKSRDPPVEKHCSDACVMMIELDTSGSWCSVCLSVSPEEGEEFREGGDPHPVHELAGPRRSRGGAAPAQAEAPRQRL